MKWSESNGAWVFGAGPVLANAFLDRFAPSERPWAWSIITPDVQANSMRSYKTAAGARAACERVARRLGVVL